MQTLSRVLLVAVALAACGGDDDDAGGGGVEASGVIGDVEGLVAECRNGGDDVVQCTEDDLAGFADVCAAVAPPDVGDEPARGFVQARPEGADFEAVVDCTFGEPRAHVGFGLEGDDVPAVCDRDEFPTCEEIGRLDVAHGGDIALFLTADNGVSVRVDSVDLGDEELAAYAAEVFATVLGVTVDAADLERLASAS